MFQTCKTTNQYIYICIINIYSESYTGRLTEKKTHIFGDSSPKTSHFGCPNPPSTSQGTSGAWTWIEESQKVLEAEVDGITKGWNIYDYYENYG